MKKCTSIVILGLLMAGCMQPDTNIERTELEMESGRIMCADPRPQMCTREYDPVCARLTDSTDKTYATGCTACSDMKVTSYIPGKCPASAD